ncbi:CBS domain-containing protein [Nannocystaceae bacterium ST9]
MKTKDVELPTAADIMISRVEAFPPDTEIAAAIETLLGRGYSGAPVVDGQGRPIGVLSEHDCVRVLASSLYEGWPTGTVADHMTKSIDTVEEHTDLLALAQRFAQGLHRRLLVVREGKLSGLITRRDLMRALDRVRQKTDTQREPSTYELIQAHRR